MPHTIHSTPVRIVLVLLLVVGVFAGTVGRAMTHGSHPACEDTDCVESVSVCKAEHAKAAPHSGCCATENDSSGDKDKQDSGSTEHHHHHICCVTPSFMVHDDQRTRFFGLGAVRAGLNLEHHFAPENPVFELDTPPLI